MKYLDGQYQRISPTIGKNEKTLLNQQEINDNCIICRQYYITDLGFWVDGYCKETNTIYEVFEKAHLNTKKRNKDLKRQKEIQDLLNCEYKIIWDIPDRLKEAVQLKLNCGCGNEILLGYINIDQYTKDNNVFNYNIINIPYPSNSVDIIFCKQVLEHLSFFDEKLFFNEVYRLLKPKGSIIIEVPDLVWIMEKFLLANDNWKEFYKKEDNHYFGNGLDMNERWSILPCHIFGNQSNEGQFHKNCYTKSKLEHICEHFNYASYKVDTFMYDKFNLQCLRLEATK